MALGSFGNIPVALCVKGFLLAGHNFLASTSCYSPKLRWEEGDGKKGMPCKFHLQKYSV